MEVKRKGVGRVMEGRKREGGWKKWKGEGRKGKERRQGRSLWHGGWQRVVGLTGVRARAQVKLDLSFFTPPFIIIIRRLSKPIRWRFFYLCMKNT